MSRSLTVMESTDRPPTACNTEAVKVGIDVGQPPGCKGGIRLGYATLESPASHHAVKKFRDPLIVNLFRSDDLGHAPTNWRRRLC